VVLIIGFGRTKWFGVEMIIWLIIILLYVAHFFSLNKKQKYTNQAHGILLSGDTDRLVDVNALLTMAEKWWRMAVYTWLCSTAFIVLKIWVSEG
jgi:uncharacterized membrane protein YukC